MNLQLAKNRDELVEINSWEGKPDIIAVEGGRAIISVRGRTSMRHSEEVARSVLKEKAEAEGIDYKTWNLVLEDQRPGRRANGEYPFVRGPVEAVLDYCSLRSQ